MGNLLLHLDKDIDSDSEMAGREQSPLGTTRPLPPPPPRQAAPTPPAPHPLIVNKLGVGGSQDFFVQNQQQSTKRPEFSSQCFGYGSKLNQYIHYSATLWIRIPKMDADPHN